MTPAIGEMTVKEERACLCEIRDSDADIFHDTVLSNGWTAGFFALKYVTGHYRKRKSKEKGSGGEVCTANALSVTDDTAHAPPTYTSDPFCSRPCMIKEHTNRQAKRTQRYRSTSKSRILGMTVGDIRYCFQQLRNAGDNLTPELVLYNGQCAGDFALRYLVETSNSMRSRQKRETRQAEQDANNQEYPESQIPVSAQHTTNRDGKVVFS